MYASVVNLLSVATWRAGVDSNPRAVDRESDATKPH